MTPYLARLAAGLLPQPFAPTADGHEQLWQVNYLSHALLADLMLPVLERTAASTGGARIVFVSSLVHHFGYRGGIRWDAVDSPLGYVPWKAYSQSKLAMLLHSRALGACSPPLLGGFGLGLRPPLPTLFAASALQDDCMCPREATATVI